MANALTPEQQLEVLDKFSDDVMTIDELIKNMNDAGYYIVQK